MKTATFAQLNVWRTAHRVAVAGYKLTRGYPADEVPKIPDAPGAGLVPANIAEGTS